MPLIFMCGMPLVFIFKHTHFDHITRRAGELRLPSQEHVVTSLNLSAIEMYHYKKQHEVISTPPPFSLAAPIAILYESWCPSEQKIRQKNVFYLHTCRSYKMRQEV
jgi:hypothetical protein